MASGKKVSTKYMVKWVEKKFIQNKKVFLHVGLKNLMILLYVRLKSFQYFHFKIGFHFVKIQTLPSGQNRQKTV